MSEFQNRQRLNKIFDDLAEELDVPASKYEEAKGHYEAVGNWLGDDDSELAEYDPVIYPQGSFALGTVLSPRGGQEFDVDCVCLLQNLDCDGLSQADLKQMVGERLKHPKSRYKAMIEPPEGSRRCWTIKYADGSKFHLDVLPAIPDEYNWLVQLGVPLEWAVDAIRITDNHTIEYSSGWPNGHSNLDPTRSNPKGYVQWFKKQMLIRLEEGREKIALLKEAEVEDIEDYEVRTPLQRLIQLLKRHRDERYGDDEDKPISIIISTLASMVYDNEADLFDAIQNVVPGMRNAIEDRGGVLWVPNPVNPLENFADKWKEKPKKRDIFYEWLKAIEAEHNDLLTDRGFEKVGAFLSESYGQQASKEVMTKYAIRESGKSGSAASAILVPRKSKPNDEPSYPSVSSTKSSKPWMY